MPFGYKAAWSNAGTGGATWAEAEALAQRLAEDEQTLKRRFWQKLRALAARLPLPRTWLPRIIARSTGRRRGM